MNRTVILNVVGLTEGMLGPLTPRLNGLLQRGRKTAIVPVFPAVTCSAQSTYLTGLAPARHGIVGNGWYDRELAEVHFWKQSNHLVHGRKVWEELRERGARMTCAQLFWWFNMYSSADYSITPRPMYPADGRKVFDIYSWPLSIRDEIKRDLGEFPFPAFWGPAAGAEWAPGGPDAASRWIGESAKWIERKYAPTLSLVYLPHLDYNLQRLGPDNPAIGKDIQAIDALVGELIDFFRARSVQVMVLSEYGVTPVDRPVHLNRMFREQGWVTIKRELGREMLDCGASKVFAVADHQVAHIYVADPGLIPQVRALVEKQPGVGRVLDRSEQTRWGIDHPRAGDLIAVAGERAWFTYYYWLEDKVAPDFARTVDIHRKPGYDPVELFIDPALRWPKLKIAARLLQKRLGFRMLMDVIPLDAGLVKGSHGARPARVADYPVLISERGEFVPGEPIEAAAVYGIIKAHVLGEKAGKPVG